MEKLTLRQFSDVIKALVEANLSKEENCFIISVSEEPDKSKAEGMHIYLTGRKDKIKKCETGESPVKCEEYEGYEILYDMNNEYRYYETRILRDDIQQSEVLRNIADSIACGIKRGKPLEEDLDENWADEELDDLDCMRRKCIAKACLIFAAIPVGLFIAKNLLKKD